MRSFEEQFAHVRDLEIKHTEDMAKRAGKQARIDAAFSVMRVAMEVHSQRSYLLMMSAFNPNLYLPKDK